MCLLQSGLSQALKSLGSNLRMSQGRDSWLPALSCGVRVSWAKFLVQGHRISNKELLSPESGFSRLKPCVRICFFALLLSATSSSVDHTVFNGLTHISRWFEMVEICCELKIFL